MIFLFFYVVSYHSRLVEVTSRLDFLWKQQAVKELADISEMRQYNAQLLKNILPDHVAHYFLTAEERRSDVNEAALIISVCEKSDVNVSISLSRTAGTLLSSQRQCRCHVCQHTKLY